MNTQATKAAIHFGCDVLSIESLTDGLIHKTYKVTSIGGGVCILQQINSTIFRNPKLLTRNYHTISHHLEKGKGFKIPTLIHTIDNTDTWLDETGSWWRAFEYIPDSYTETESTSVEMVFRAAACYGDFVRFLFDFDSQVLVPVISGFHDLNLRFEQLKQAISHGNPERLTRSKALLEAIDERKGLLHFYTKIIHDTEFKIRAMHHDCKLSNVLFSSITKKAICPIDLDTVMPGYFFSDVGDMVRSMVSSADENSPAELVTVRKDIYEAIISGYQSGIQDSFTETEKKYLHHAGMLMIYMQSIRFLTDYLMSDQYYRISYPEQNFSRAINQITLLKKLEQFLREEYTYRFE